MPKYTDFKVSVFGSGRFSKFAEAGLTSKTRSLFDKWLKKEIGEDVVRYYVTSSGAVVFNVNRVLSNLSGTAFQRSAKEAFEARLKAVQGEKFRRWGFGTWPPLRKSTIKRRQLKIDAGVAAEGGTRRPLWFTGTLKRAAQSGFYVSNFHLFNEKSFTAGKLRLSGFKIIVDYKEPEDVKAPVWYWHPNGVSTFKQLIGIQSQRRVVFLTGGRLRPERGGGYDISREVGKGELFRKVWIPFINEDWPKLFTRIKYPTGGEGKMLAEARNWITGGQGKLVLDKLRGVFGSGVDEALRDRQVQELAKLKAYQSYEGMHELIRGWVLGELK